MYKKILFISTLFVLFLSMFVFRHYFCVFHFQNDLHKLAINVETPESGKIYICFNKNCDFMEYENGIYSYNLNGKKAIFHEDVVDNIEIISKKPLKYKGISLFVSKDFYYFKDLEQKEIEFNSNNAYSINIPFSNNNKTFIQKISVYFESIFYSWYFYILFWVLALVYTIKYKPKIRLNVSMIFILALILRISHIDFISLWNDELYTLCRISDMSSGLNLKNTFLDPGNPPLFFILSNIWLLFFNKSIAIMRLLPLTIGMIGIYSIYWVTKRLLNKKTALIASFLASINLFMILESNELRSYILTMTIIVWGLYYFYKLKNNFNNKNLILFAIISILLINTHYYCVLYVIFNFILGMILFKEKTKFLFTNCIIFLSFLPYFIVSHTQALAKDFNTWIEPPSLTLLYNHILFYFGNIVFFILTILFCTWIFKKLKKREKIVFIYTTSSITFVFICAFLISVILKPILFERYFCIFLPFLIINTAIFLNKKLNPILLFLIFLSSINMPKYENYNLFPNVNFAFQYALKDSTNYDKNDVYYVVPDTKEYIKYFPKIDKNKVILSKFGVREDIDLIKFYLSEIQKKGKVVLYLPEICINSEIKYSQTLNIKRIETTYVPIYKIVIE